MTERTDLITLELHYHHETNGALLVSENGDERKVKPIPKSFSTWEPESPMPYQGIKVTVPRWFAEREGYL